MFTGNRGITTSTLCSSSSLLELVDSHAEELLSDSSAEESSHLEQFSSDVCDVLEEHVELDFIVVIKLVSQLFT
jgi:hypothetical protein